MVKLFGVAHHEQFQLVLVDVFARHSIHVVGCHLLNAGREALQKVSRITVKLISHLFRQNLVFLVELEDERIQDRVLRALEFYFRGRMLFQVI